MNVNDSRDAFERDIDALMEAIPDAIEAARAALVGDAFEQIVEASPVRTGEYRASHTIGIGSERTESFLFEHPDRPEPDLPADARRSDRPRPRTSCPTARVLQGRAFRELKDDGPVAVLRVS